MWSGGIDEVDEAGAAVELGEEECGVGLRLRGFDPLQARSDWAVAAASFSQHSATVAAQPHDDSDYVTDVGFCAFVSTF